MANHMVQYSNPVKSFYQGRSDAAAVQAEQRQEQRQNALFDMRQKEFDAQQKQQNRLNTRQDLQWAQEDGDTKNKRIYASTAWLLDSLDKGQPIDPFKAPPEVQKSLEELRGQLTQSGSPQLSPEQLKRVLSDAHAEAAARLGIVPPQPQAQDGFTLSQGQQRFDASGKPIASVAPTPKDPQKPGYGAPQSGINPQGKPDQFIVDDNGQTRWLGIPPIPPANSSGAAGTKAQQGKWQNDMRQAQIAMQQARKLAPEIGKAVGFKSNLKTATARAVGQTGISGTDDVYGDVITARQRLSQFAQQSLTPLIMSQAKGTKEQERLLGLLPKSGDWFTNEAQAKRNINEIMDWVQMETDQNALNLNIDPQTLENRWEPLPINVTQGDSGDPEHDAKVDAIMNKSFGATK